MIRKIDQYVALISAFIDGAIDVATFRDSYIDKFKREDVTLPGEIFDILDQLFADADSFTEEEDLLASLPTFYISADELKEQAMRTLAELADHA